MIERGYIGIDLGGTKILTAVSDSKGNILSSVKVTTEAEKGRTVILQNIYNSISAVLREAGMHKDNIERIGIGSPGPLDAREGVIIENSNLPWKNVPIVKLVEEKTGIKTRLQNDANTAALGENVFGAGQDIENMIYITVSTGVGGGIIINNRLYQGINGNAGEIGHMIIDPDGPLCGCGNQGCLESFSSGTAIGLEGRRAVRLGKSPILNKLAGGDPDQINARLVAKAAHSGCDVCLDIYQKAGKYLGIGLANLVNIFNPELIIFGGGVMKARELFYEEMEQKLSQIALEGAYKMVSLVDTVLGDEIGVKGALALAMQNEAK